MSNGFYQSDPWIDLMGVLRIERVDDMGQVICEHCGKPIIKKYDCIGHHIIELTDENVHDAMISLNPDNIALVHHRCHNIIHNKLGYAGRQVFLVWGSPLSGKTTWVESVRNEGDLIVDMDSIWQCISGCGRYIKPNRLKQNAFAVRDLLIDMVKVRRGRWDVAYIIGGYPLISERERLLKSLGAREVFIDTPKEECLARLQDSDRDVEEWTKFIEEWWQRYSPHLP